MGKCRICKRNIRGKLMDHINKYHHNYSSDDEQNDPDFDPEKTSGEDTESMDETDIQPKEKCESPKKSVKQSFKPIIKKDNAPKSSKKSQLKSPNKDGSINRRKTVTSRRGHKVQFSARQATSTTDRVQINLNALPPLKNWKIRSKKHRKRTANRAQSVSGSNRNKFLCRICSLEVTHLPRHLRDVHDMSKQDSLDYSRMNRMTFRIKKPKRQYWKCPVKGCTVTVQWLEQHLRQVHKMTMAATKYVAKRKRSALSESEDEVEGGHDMEPAINPTTHHSDPETTNTVSDPATIQVPDPNQSVSDPIQSVSKPIQPVPDPIQPVSVAVETVGFKPDFQDSMKQQPVLQEFFKWLSSLEAGKTEKSAEQHTKQVLAIWAAVDRNLNVTSITDGNAIRDKFFDARSDLAPGTKKSYIVSLRLLYNYMRFHDIKCSERVTKLMIQTNLWMTNLSKAEAIRRTTRQVQDTEELIKPDEITTMLNSNVCQHIYGLFENVNSGEAITMASYCKMRNFLILIILLTNGQRTGSIMNLTMRSIKCAYINDKGEAHLYVTQHKTAKAGPVNLVLKQQFWKLLQIFIKKVRPQLPIISNSELQHDDSCVFLTFPGVSEKPQPMCQSVINNALQSIWIASKQESNISATKLRKSIVTHVRKVAPDQKDALALQMTHRTTTADKYYHLVHRQDNAFKTVELITKVMTNIKQNLDKTSETNITHKPVFQPNISETQTSQTETPQETTVQSESLIPTSTQQSAKSSEQEIDPTNIVYTAVPLGKAKPLETSSTQPIPFVPHGRRAFSREDAHFLIQECSFIIHDPPITQTRVVDTLTKTPKGREFVRKYTALYGTAFAKKATDRLQTERKKLRSSN